MNLDQSEIQYYEPLVGSLLNSMQEAMLVLNPVNEIAIVNDAALVLFGCAEESDLTGKNIQEIFTSPEDLKKMQIFFEQEGHSDKWKSSFRKEDGREFTGSYSIAVFKHKENSGLIKLMLIRDITEQETSAKMLAEYTRKLEKNNSELDQFAHIVSHDLKAPLRAISNLSLWLQEDLGTSLTGENKDNFVMLRNRVTRMESLINGILEYSKVGREHLPSERVDVLELLHEVLELLSPAQHVKINLVAPMPILDVPKIMLHQVFSNLISNAIKYNDKKEALISIYAKETVDAIEFTVEDNGPGIPAEYHEKIFVIFQTLQSRDKYESTGIGLTIVKRIIAARGGKIRVESEMGKGTKFIVDWPK
jgi:PAS domain S-box-containing protein